MAKTKAPAKKADVVKSVDDLKKELSEKEAQMMETRRSHRAGELVNPRALTHGRKEIARLKTAIRADELKEKK